MHDKLSHGYNLQLRPTTVSLVGRLVGRLVSELGYIDCDIYKDLLSIKYRTTFHWAADQSILVRVFRNDLVADRWYMWNSGMSPVNCKNRSYNGWEPADIMEVKRLMLCRKRKK